MIGAPLLLPGVNAIEADLLPGAATRFVGANGPPGVTDTGADAVPPPTSFTARNAMSYLVPLVRPGIVTGEVVAAGSSAIHVGDPSPGFNEYS